MLAPDRIEPSLYQRYLRYLAAVHKDPAGAHAPEGLVLYDGQLDIYVRFKPGTNLYQLGQRKLVSSLRELAENEYAARIDFVRLRELYNHPDVLYLSPLDKQPVQDTSQSRRSFYPQPQKQGRIANLIYQIHGEMKDGSEAGMAKRPEVSLRDNRLLIDFVSSDCTTLNSRLTALGIEVTAVYGKVLSAWVPLDKLNDIEKIAEYQVALPSLFQRQVGVVTSQGDSAQRSDIARNSFGKDGSGVLVGTLSDSFDCLGGASEDVANNDLPDAILVLDDLDSGCSDEGRAMMQIIHDVAPGAEQAFHTAFKGIANFAQGIIDLADAGAQIINDDVIYLGEPMFQDGLIAQAVDQVAQRGVTYFSSAGNNGNSGYQDEARWVSQVPSILGLVGGYDVCHDFDPSAGVDITQEIQGQFGGDALTVFQWDSPALSACSEAPCRGAEQDLDIFLLDFAGNIIAVANSSNIGADPVEFLGVNLLLPGDSLAICRWAPGGGPLPTRLGLVDYADLNELTYYPDQPGSRATIYGHANARGAIAVGASWYLLTPRFGTSPPEAEPFTSLGSVPILIDTRGNVLDEPSERVKPALVAPDGANTSFFGFDVEPDGFPNFFGTSAAAPHAAGVAALLLQANPALSPVELRQVLSATAVDMDDSSTPEFDAGFDLQTGFGLIQADAALEAVLQGLTSPAKAVRDFDGDGYSDLFWRHPQVGVNWISLNTLSDDDSPLDSSPLNTTQGTWRYVGSACFDDNATADILWRDLASGQVGVYQMEGNRIRSQVTLAQASADWEVKGIGDIDADGDPDIVWRNKNSGMIWLFIMDGTRISQSRALLQERDRDWDIVGVADADGDGQVEIYWQNTTSGAAHLLKINGNRYSRQTIANGLGANWKVAALLDSNGDRQEDLLWFNLETGQYMLALMRGNQIRSQVTLPVNDASGPWRLATTGDFDANGTEDILWQNSQTAELRLFLLNGASLLADQVIGEADRDWVIEP